MRNLGGKKMKNIKKNKKGFTLVELLVVIAIIGILAVVAVPALFKNINKAKVADVEADYSAIKSSVLSYYSEENKLPVGLEDSDKGKGLSDFMDTVPKKSALGGNYKLMNTKDTDKALYLQIDGAKITHEQLSKLAADIGFGNIQIGATGDTDLTTVSSSSDTKLLAGENKIIRLMLIKNTDM